MRWIRYTTKNGTQYGIAEGDRIVEVEGDPFRGYRRTDRKVALADVTIEVPVVPPTFYCVGLNYAAHVTAAAKKMGLKVELPKRPEVGYRAQSALLPHGQPVIIPRDAGPNVQYEAELVVVIGKKARRLSKADALSCVLGYTIGNDVSERTWQKADRTLWRSKNADTFKPMGPWIETDVGDLDKLETIIRVNGTETERFATNAMIFGVADYIEAITQYMTLSPGDVLWMGTDGHAPNIKAGDVVEIEISGIGVLKNPFMAEV